MAGKRGSHFSSAGRERCRTSKPGKANRPSRAGQDSHPSKIYVRKAAPAVEPEIEHAPPVRRKPVTLPTLTCLQPKKIGGELI
jgi:hypothetical protein